jgi:lysophospholipase L1-like esterase
VLSLLLAELGIRLVFPAPETGNLTQVPGEIRTQSPWPGMPYRLQPGAEVRHQFPSDPRGYFDPGATLLYQINLLGFRGEETTRAKPPGLLRIVGLGDSFTFGIGVRAEDTFLAVLDANLRAHGEKSVEVLNLGVMGFDTPHEVALLRHLGLQLDPDLVVLCFFLNDTQGGATHELFNLPQDSEPPLWRRLRLLDLAATALERRGQVQQLVASYRRSFQPDANGWLLAKQSLAQAKRLSRRRRFDLVLMIFPVLWDLSGDYPFQGIHTTVREAAESLEIPVLDLLPAFAGHDGPELWVHPTNQHANEVAHAIAGDALYNFLHARRLPSPRSTPPRSPR